MPHASRRRLLVGLAVAAAGVMTRAAGAQPARLVKIGVLTPSWGPTPAVVGLREGLQALGYREDEHFTIGVRFTEGRPAALPAAARDLVGLGVDLIVTTEATSAKAAQAATTRIPIVFTSASDPVGMGLVQSFARPGGNVTGIADLDVQLAPKRMELFHELIPGLRRIVLPYDATTPHAVDPHVEAHRAAAKRRGLVLVEKPVRSEDEARAAITGLRKADADGIISPRFISFNIPGFILEVAARVVIPTMFHDPFWVERGGLASYSASYHALGLQAARLVDKIMRGAKPTDLPVEQPTKFEFVVNSKTAKALGMTIAPPMLLRADRTIE